MRRSASKPTSGSARLVDPVRLDDCHDGAASYLLYPPPVDHTVPGCQLGSFQTISLLYALVDVLVNSVVPPTAITYGDVAGSLTV